MKSEFNVRGLVIEYRRLGTIALDELKQAIIADLNALHDQYGISYVTGTILRIFPTNEYGEDVTVTKPEGGRVLRIDTHHYRPACKDYEL